MTGVLLVCLAAVSGPALLPAWTFDADLQGWTPNNHLADVTVQNGVLVATATGPDPFLTRSGIEIPATPWQYVIISIKASRPGEGELFWTGETQGQYGGFSQEKTTRFEISQNPRAQDIVLFPFWHGEGTIRQLRLDLYNNAKFEINAIRIMQWGHGATPITDTYSWSFGENLNAWRITPRSRYCFSPPLDLPVEGKSWVGITAKSRSDCIVNVVWSTRDGRGMESAPVKIAAGATPRLFNANLTGHRGWKGNLVALGVRLPVQMDFELHAIEISDKPMGPALLSIDYAGFGDAINRVRKPARFILQASNQGGSDSPQTTARLVLSPALRFVDSRMEQPVEPIACGASRTIEWRITAQEIGPHHVMARVADSPVAHANLMFSDELFLPKETYVPEPAPIKTSVDICAYYFPGWEKPEKWDCIRSKAPIRKPVLGYYAEGNPECVDWQIKWAVENGISCFFVDWYWVAGRQQLTHWFDAYRKAKYRDMLKVAVMWANHNPPNTHSLDDWRNVTQHWLDQYFSLPAYYKIEGKPLVLIWDPRNVRRDLNGSDAVKQAMDMSQKMARQAGYPGIAFWVVNSDYSKEDIETLAREGYTGITNYHEWGVSAATGQNNQYASVVQNAPTAWETKNAAAVPLEYYPVVDTGWDSRPWHGDDALAFQDRTADHFANLLQKAKEFVQAKGKNVLVLGPVNEWGEGSYIEPCLEYGFSMYQAIRTTFATGAMEKWPVNFGPTDVGLGPYDY